MLSFSSSQPAKLIYSINNLFFCCTIDYLRDYDRFPQQTGCFSVTVIKASMHSFETLSHILDWGYKLFLPLGMIKPLLE